MIFTKSSCSAAALAAAWVAAGAEPADAVVVAPRDATECFDEQPLRATAPAMIINRAVLRTANIKSSIVATAAGSAPHLRRVAGGRVDAGALDHGGFFLRG
jgi:hypothetical protein